MEKRKKFTHNIFLLECYKCFGPCTKALTKNRTMAKAKAVKVMYKNSLKKVKEEL